MTAPRSATGDAGADPLRAALEQALGAQYEVLQLLGRGGMGAVYLARERLLERLVAIKVLPSEHADDEARARFLREARTAAQLSHPNIVPLLSFGELGETLFYIMRYVEGESLEARLRRETTVPHAEARRMLGELADALAEAHRLGIVHRDLKPDNIMIDRTTGRAMLTDFGIARSAASSATLTGTGMIVGTPQYMSPEQASGDRALDGRSDIYSLGIVGYRMLTGRLPFTATDVRDVLLQQITVEPVPVTTNAPDAPLDLADAVMRCLAKDPSRRWPDATSLRQAISSSATDDMVLPESLEKVPRSGPRMLQVLYGANFGFGVLYAFTKDPEWLAMALGSTVFGVAVPMVALALQARRESVSLKRVLTIAFWPSTRSFLWWPRALRPPDDVFDRLPVAVRRARIWQSLGVMALTCIAPAVLLAAAVVGSSDTVIRFRLVLAGFATINLSVIGLGISAFLAGRLGRRWSLSKIEANKLIAEPTHGSRFWQRPAIAALLSGDEQVDEARSLSTEGMARAVRELGTGLPESASTIAREAGIAATELASELLELDRRLAEMATQSDPAEQRRLASRLEALGPEVSDESGLNRQMRSLLRGQEALLAELESRRSQLQARRGHRHEQLRTLWLQMVNYRAQLSAQGAHAADISDRIRELCRSIEHRIDAADETERIVSAQKTPG